MELRTSRQRQATQTREKIFTCAMRLFAENSYENVTISDISRAANVSVGAFYHHFKNKESLLNEGYRLFDNLVEQQWGKGHPDDTIEAIHFLVDAQMTSMAKMGAPASAQYFKNQLSNKEKYILDTDRFFYTTICRSIQTEVEHGRLHGDAKTITDDILSTCRGIIYDWCLHDGGYDLAEKGNRVLDMVLNHYRP